MLKELGLGNLVLTYIIFTEKINLSRLALNVSWKGNHLKLAARHKNHFSWNLNSFRIRFKERQSDKIRFKIGQRFLKCSIFYLKYGMSWLSEPDYFHLFHLSSYSKGSASCSNSSEIIWLEPFWCKLLQGHLEPCRGSIKQMRWNYSWTNHENV